MYKKNLVYFNTFSSHFMKMHLPRFQLHESVKTILFLKKKHFHETRQLSRGSWAWRLGVRARATWDRRRTCWWRRPRRDLSSSWNEMVQLVTFSSSQPDWYITKSLLYSLRKRSYTTVLNCSIREYKGSIQYYLL